MTLRFILPMHAMVTLVAAALIHPSASSASTPAPDWIQDLVIYEVAPKTFTSPNGPGSGTFDGLKARLPYLQELGVTGIWLAGFAAADNDHFYNIWSNYAVVEPDRLDPSLGTREQFRAMVAEAHRHGIKILLDVVTHGVTEDSPLVKRHPEWFRGSTWGMIDYDWYGGRTDLDEWWVKTWTDYVVQDGVDGFRLDVNMYRPDLWARIRKNAADAGHPIVILDETNPALPGVTDFEEHDLPLLGKMGELASTNLPAYFDRLLGLTGEYSVKVEFADGTTAEGRTGGTGPLDVNLEGLSADRVSRRLGDYVGIDPYIKDQFRVVRDIPRSDGLPDLRLAVNNLGDAKIRNVTVENEFGQKWALTGSVPWFLDAPVGFGVKPLVMDRDGSNAQLYIATLAYGYRTFTLSCHDLHGYVARGSRSLFGYAFLFAPVLPIFVGGEEFDADFHAHPSLSDKPFGASNPGKGTWLYGTVLDWNELKIPSKRAMLEDVKKMLAIRTQERGVLAVRTAATKPALEAVPHESQHTLPIPYMRWNGNTAIVVLANQDTMRDAQVTLQIPYERFGGSRHSRFRITDLWGTEKSRIYSAAGLERLVWTVRKDKTPGGGLAVMKIEVVSPPTLMESQ